MGSDLYRQQMLHWVVGEAVRRFRQARMSSCQRLQVLGFQEIGLSQRWRGRLDELRGVLAQQGAHHREESFS